MNRTQTLGITLFVIGYITVGRFPNSVWGGFALFLGLFLIWNGGVANYNRDIDFAIFQSPHFY
tara:strand:- start:503 stop:691 length:189 start_codon:yes stop_codon:yes gene_type:complete